MKQNVCFCFYLFSSNFSIYFYGDNEQEAINGYDHQGHDFTLVLACNGNYIVWNSIQLYPWDYIGYWRRITHIKCWWPVTNIYWQTNDLFITSGKVLLYTARSVCSTVQTKCHVIPWDGSWSDPFKRVGTKRFVTLLRFWLIKAGAVQFEN